MASTIHHERSGEPKDARLKGYMYDTNRNWVKLPARQLLRGVTAVHGTRVFHSPIHWISLASLSEWVEQRPKSVYVENAREETS
eukprot:2637621-Amphidinium_carterae.1